MSETPDILQRTLGALDLEELGGDRFRGDPGGGRSRLYGGLVAAQSVMAAGRTVDRSREVHALHASFLRSGRPDVPIHFSVDRARDGGSYSCRQVRAEQGGKLILASTVSFSREEAGMSRQSVEKPDVPGPEGLVDREQERSRRYREALGVHIEAYESAVEVRLCDPTVVEPGQAQGARQENWMRVSGPLGLDPLLRRAMLVYASDRTLLATARLPYALGRHRLLAASLDLAIWMHRPVDLSQWHLCESRSPVAHGGRAMIHAHIYRADGVCVATVAQEGLVRVRRQGTTVRRQARGNRDQGGGAADGRAEDEEEQEERREVPRGSRGRAQARGQLRAGRADEEGDRDRAGDVGGEHRRLRQLPLQVRQRT